MVHGLPTANNVTQQSEPTKQIKSQHQDEELNDNRNWLPVSNCKNIQNPGLVKFSRFRIRFNGKFGSTEIESQPNIVTVELEAEFGEPVASPLLGLGVFNNLNELVIHFNSFATSSNLDNILAGRVVRFKFQFTMPPLRHGEYLITIGIDDGLPNASVVLCHVYDLLPFRVRTADLLRAQSGYVAVADATVEMHTDGEI
jgi:lipopolysaccharide transport system ATP-binding protein